MVGEIAIRDQIIRLLSVRKKIKAGDYLTSREEQDVSRILGIPKFKNRKDIETKVDDLFLWLDGVLKKN